ncbi:DNA polymerase III subunit gamma and tau [Corynebacterium silvaticum]|uniref:DNA-directed DNA polymerase n=1 Tax=Corynebacterium silvaticum TaxID=2320431 RepID=A0A7Y4LKW2_9CORY|nr:DNA polymerase III subunit gamma and tau [Corynebacterium silvaticum]ARU45346.1 DNA polymerase III subunit gamma and tau [Corynebacterium silvaticum]NON70722.1 DNA polymerase III subunit gamma and tau [Corynebacterium silvaticum]
MALYRKYRPASFAEVVGQEQVTQPLSVALDSGRINHAYLFSGPRGCGKTSSARIMARSLNCVEGPTSTPCGKCNSCISLAPNGPGNLDVTELDAASNNSVDDMRELRDRAMYAPAESRYRIFIIDEAHMVTTQGANALLKIVEEPPEHLIFIFATTEPEKVIGTIRSRTHHYPFRLLTPQSMRGLLETTVASEGALVEDSVYPMVIRAGGGSPRDTLSVLDQLLAGTGPQGLSYETARLLLGATDDALIDAAITALSSQDKAALFTTIDSAVEAGLDPRRFATDLLDRLRDLMVLQAVPDAFELGLVDAPTDRADVMRAQAADFHQGEVAHLAALVNDGLRGLKGATSPRLLLEILCAKMLLPSTPATVALTPPPGNAQPAGLPTGGQSSEASAAIPAKYERKSVRMAREAAQRKAAQEEAAQRKAAQEEAAQREAVQQEMPQPKPVAQAEKQASVPEPEPRKEHAAEKPETPSAAKATPVPELPTPTVAPSDDVETAAEGASISNDDAFVADVRARWSTLRKMVHKKSAVAGILLAESCVLGMREGTLVLGHNTGPLAQGLNLAKNNDVIVEVIRAELGRDVIVDCIVGTDPAAAGFSEPQAEKAWSPEPEVSEPETSEPAPAPAATPVAAEPIAAEQEKQPDVAQQAPQPRVAEKPPAPAEPASSTWGEPAPIGGDTQRAPRTEPPTQVAQTTGWGEPAPLGGQPDAVNDSPAKSEQSEQPPQGTSQQPARKVEQREVVPTVPTPVPATPPVQTSPVQKPPAQKPPVQKPKSRWQEAVARSAQAAEERAKRPEFSDGVPLPPEPDDFGAPDSDDWTPPEEPYRYAADEGFPEPTGGAPQPSQEESKYQRHRSSEPTTAVETSNVPDHDEEEEMVREAASGSVTRDHRDALTVAMDLLAEQLGARQL